MRLLKDLWETESARVVTWHAKMNKFQEKLTLRLIELEEIEEANMLKGKSAKIESDLTAYDVSGLEAYFETYVRNVVVYFIRDDDREFMQTQKTWLKLSKVELDPTPAKRSVPKKPLRSARATRNAAVNYQ